MVMKQFMVRYSVFGDFKIDSSGSFDDFAVHITPKEFILTYSFESNKLYKDVLQDILNDHLNLSDLVSCTLGSLVSGYQIGLYERTGQEFELVGNTVYEYRMNGFRLPIFNQFGEIHLLLKNIIEAQIRYSSRLRNVVLTAINMADSGTHREIMHQRSWNAFEWFIRALSDRKGFTLILDYDIEINGKTANLRAMVHQSVRNELKSLLRKFDSIISSEKEKDNQLLSDLAIISRLAESFNLFPSIMEMYDQLSDFFKETLKTYQDCVQDTSLQGALELDVKNHAAHRSLIQDAKDARDSFVHSSKFGWKRTGLSDMEGLVKFRSLISIWLLTAMTRNPMEFDSNCEVINIIQLPEDFKVLPPSKTPIEGIYKIQVQDGDDVIEEESAVEVKLWDYENRQLSLSAKERMTLFESFYGRTYPFQKPVSAECTVTCKDIEFVGMLDATRFYEGRYVNVRSWYYI